MNRGRECPCAPSVEQSDADDAFEGFWMGQLRPMPALAQTRSICFVT